MLKIENHQFYICHNFCFNFIMKWGPCWFCKHIEMVMGFALRTEGWCMYFSFSNERSSSNSVFPRWFVSFLQVPLSTDSYISWVTGKVLIAASENNHCGRVFWISFRFLGWFRPWSQHNSELLLRQICFNILPSWVLGCCPGNAHAACGSDYEFSSPSPKSRDCRSVILWSRLACQQCSFWRLLFSGHVLYGFCKFLETIFLRLSISCQI